MFNKIITICILAALIPSFSFAQEDVDKKTHFQQMFSLPTQDILVPTVIEVPLPDMTGVRKQFLVVEQSTGAYVASSFEQDFVVEPVPVGIRVNGTARPNLLDDDQRTSETFPLPQESTGLVEFFVDGSEAFAASSFVIDLAQNVSLPVSIEVKALRETGEEIVLAKTKPNSTHVRFPQVTASSWYISMEYIQPLRLNELRFVQDDVESSLSNSLRFLAQPETTYQVFLDPEVFVSFTTTEGGNLSSDDDVLVLENRVVFQNNQLFTFADSDSDSIADQVDNCVLISNVDQIDVNQNGRGDVCDDFDRDGVVNSIDNCQNNPNRNQADEDGDGIGNVCDEGESRVTEKYVWIPWAAMAGAISVFILLFWIMIRRMHGEMPEIKEKETVKEPVTDRTDI